VREDQFLALEDFPKKLEKFFGTYPPQNRVYYERRSRQYDSSGIEKTRVITFPDMLRVFAAMFLNEPHRTTKSYAGLVKQVGTDIFNKDHRMEPYYVAAFARYKLEYYFRAERLPARLKPARFHILMAMRIVGVGFEMPKITANKMEAYCDSLADILQHQTNCDTVIVAAAAIIDEVAGENYSRDFIRTESFTQKVIALSREKSGGVVKP
jgi:hypothetical protein